MYVLFSIRCLLQIGRGTNECQNVTKVDVVVDVVFLPNKTLKQKLYIDDAA